MNRKFLLALLGYTVLALISPRSAPATGSGPIQGTDVGLEGDPGSIIVSTTKTDAEGKFEFHGLKAGKYRLVLLPSDSKTAQAGASTNLPQAAARNAPLPGGTPTEGTQPGARVFRIVNVRGNASQVIAGTVDPKTGRSLQTITIDMDGGTVKGVIGELQDADDLPSQSRRATIAPMPTKNQPGLTELPVTLRDGPDGSVKAKEAPGSPMPPVPGAATGVQAAGGQPAAGAPSGPFKIGENESPVPQNRQAAESPMPTVAPMPGNLISKVEIRVEGAPGADLAGTTTTVFGQPVTFTATVTAGGGTPTGTVTFKNGAAILGTTSLRQGSGSYALAPPAVGNHTITAVYSGDADFAVSTSKALAFTVNVAPGAKANMGTGGHGGAGSPRIGPFYPHPQVPLGTTAGRCDRGFR